MSAKNLCFRLVFVWAMLSVAMFFPSGCKPVGKASGGRTATELGGVGQPTRTELTQPSNPSEKATNSTARKETAEEPVPLVSSRITETKQPDGSVTTVKEEFAPVTRKNVVETSSQTSVGGAHKDESLEIMAKISAMRPIQFVGVAFMAAAAGIMFYAPLRILVGGGKQLPIVMGAIGLLLVFAPQIIPGNEKLILIGSFVALLIYWLSIRLTRKEAEADAAKTS